MARLKCGDQNCTACPRYGRTRDLYNRRISSLFLYLKLLAMDPSTLLAVLQIFSVCFVVLPLKAFGDDDPKIHAAIDLLSATVDWTCYSRLACCCVRCASQNIYQLWRSFATCLVTKQQLLYNKLPINNYGIISYQSTVNKLQINSYAIISKQSTAIV